MGPHSQTDSHDGGQTDTQDVRTDTVRTWGHTGRQTIREDVGIQSQTDSQDMGTITDRQTGLGDTLTNTLRT